MHVLRRRGRLLDFPDERSGDLLAPLRDIRHYVEQSRRWLGPEDLFRLDSASIQTGCLLLSSFTFGLVTLSAHRQVSIARTMIWLVVTLALGAGFLGFEISAFIDMAQQKAGISASSFLSSFYALVGRHGLHVTVGCMWILIMLLRLGWFGLTPPVISRIVRLRLFWHFLDIIGIGIFSIVYLIGLAK